jgi:hypothetical protein
MLGSLLLSLSWVWVMPIIPAHRRLRQEDHEFKVSLDYIVRPCLKKTKISKRIHFVLCKYLCVSQLQSLIC